MAAIEIPQFAELVSAVARQLPRDIDSALAQRWINEQGNLAKALRSALCQEVQGTATVAPTAVTEWQKLFGHLRVWDPDFSESHFPLGEDPRDEAEEVAIYHLVTGHQAVAEVDRLERQGASLWAQGRYINAHPNAQKERPLVGIGAQWQNRHGSVYFPVFYWFDGEPVVVIRSLAYRFDPDYCFLLRKEQGV